jgi:hypothetical protein
MRPHYIDPQPLCSLSSSHNDHKAPLVNLENYRDPKSSKVFP